MTTEASPSVSLAIPDPRKAPIPVGWATDTFATLLPHLDWGDLEEAEARIRGLASEIESLKGDHTELLKAWRLVEIRRGELLDPDVKPGGRPNLPMRGEVGSVSSQTASRYRKMARNFDLVWPLIVNAKAPHEVSQSALLKKIEEHEAREVGPAAPKRSAPQDVKSPSANELPAKSDPAADTGDLITELEEADKTIRRQQAVIDAIEADDPAAKVVEWAQKYAQLEGHLQRQNAKLTEAERIIKANSNVLGQVRAILNVASNSEIVGALRDLLR